MTNIFRYNLGDTYPDLKGAISYEGSVATETMLVSFISNGDSIGPFTGAVFRTGGESENATSSTFLWTYDIRDIDTQAEGSYNICLKVEHIDGSIETIPLTTVIVEEGCTP